MRTCIYPNGIERKDLGRVNLGQRLRLFHHDEFNDDNIRDSKKKVVYYVVVEMTVDGQTAWVEIEKNES